PVNGLHLATVSSTARRDVTAVTPYRAEIMKNGKLPPILVVDDNHDNAEIIRQYLEIRGYPITVAHDGDEALVLFETVKPALVLLDVMMPGRDGWEVCRIMKQHPTLGRRVRV